MKVTMRDIARECGVSYYTVSSVLHGRSDVGAETRQRVWAAIKRMNYDPLKNMPLAKRVHARTMVLILPDNSASRDPFFQRAVITAVSAASTRQYGCEVFSEKPALEVMEADPLRVHAYDGVLVFCPHLPWEEPLRTVTGQGIPAVIIRRPTGVPGVVAIGDDDAAGMDAAVAHLYGLGHRGIGFVSSGPGRSGAFTAATAARGIPPAAGSFVDAGGLGEQGLKERLAALTGDGGVTALVCDTDRVAALVIKRLAGIGRRVPEDVSVTGYNNDYIAEVFNPGITTVEIPVEEMVRQGFDILCSLADGKKGTAAQLHVPNTLIVRESSGPVKNTARQVPENR